MSMEYKVPFTAKEVEERLAQFTFDEASNTLNVVTNTTNFGDAVSVGIFEYVINVVPVYGEEKTLYFDFVCNDSVFTGIEWTTSYNTPVGDPYHVYYIKNDGGKVVAYESVYDTWEMSSRIQPVMKISEFMEIYNNNQQNFTVDTKTGIHVDDDSRFEVGDISVSKNVITTPKINIGNIALDEDAVNELKGLELMGSFYMTVEEFQSDLRTGNIPGQEQSLTGPLVNKTRFIGMSGILLPVARGYNTSVGDLTISLSIDTTSYEAYFPSFLERDRKYTIEFYR